MAFTAHLGAQYNVEGAFNNFFQTQLTAAGVPSFMPSAVVNYEHPNQPLTYPSFSVTHMSTINQEVAEGRHLDGGFKGARKIGLADVSCWVDYQQSSGQGNRNLRQMGDMISRVFATGAAFQILDVYGTTANPTGNGTLVRCEPAEESDVAPDLNPAIIRKRFVIQYNWLERVAG